MTSGGVVPGGIVRSTVWAMAVTCDTAASMCAFGWKKTFTTEMPASVCDSMCSMSLTVVVTARS